MSNLVFDNYIERTIGGKAYKFSLRNRQIFECERKLQGKNLLTLINGQVICTEDMYTLFAYAAKGGGLRLPDDALFDLFLSAIAELGYDGVSKLVLDVFIASGILGVPKKAEAAEEA